MDGGAMLGFASAPVWDVRTLPATQGVPALMGGAHQSPASPQAPPQLQQRQTMPVQKMQVDLSEELANKAAEITVLRSRLSQVERDNVKMKNEVAISKDQSAQNDDMRKMRAEVEKLQNELRYSRQDLVSSEEERKRLRTSCEGVKTELQAMRSQQNKAASPRSAATPQQQIQSAPLAALPGTRAMQGGAPAMPLSAPSVVGQAPTVPQLPRATSSSSTHLSTVAPQLIPGPKPKGNQKQKDILLRELASWESIFKARPCETTGLVEHTQAWFVIQDAISQLASNPSGRVPQGVISAATPSGLEIATSIARQLRLAHKGKQWVAVQKGARFVQVLFSIFPETISMVKIPSQTEPASDVSLVQELTEALHDAILGSPGGEGTCTSDAAEENNAFARHDCAAQLLSTLLEMAGKLRPHELDVFSNVFHSPSLCAILAASPHSKSLHLPCMKLLQALLASGEMYVRAHGAHSHENPLLAIANLLVVPAIHPGSDKQQDQDNSILQKCRVAALSVFCRCLASAPKLDMVLQLRGAPSLDGTMVDTVMQRIVFLCHHELLCLGLHGVKGGAWHEHSMSECAEDRRRSVELSLTILSSFVWHAAAWTPDMEASEHTLACTEACNSLGRMRPLLASIVDMVVRRAAGCPYYTRQLGSVSTLRVLLAHVDGEDTRACNQQSRASSNGENLGSAMVPMVVE
jgi:hypothetical protein